MNTVKRRALTILMCVLLALLPAAEAFAYWRVNTAWLKAHEKPDYSAKVADSYRRDFAVMILSNGKGGWSRFGSDAATNSFTDTAVKSGVPDTYTVRCLDSNGNTISDYNHTGWSHTFIGTPKITSLSSTSGGVKITWGKVNGAVKYRVFYKGRNGWTRLGDTTSTSFTDSVVSNGSTYTYTVRCIDNNGNFVSGYDNTGKSIKYVK